MFSLPYRELNLKGIPKIGMPFLYIIKQTFSLMTI